MKSFRKYVTEKLVISKDIKIDVWDKYDKGDVCLMLAYLKSLKNVRECVAINVVKLNNVNKKLGTISVDGWSSDNNSFMSIKGGNPECKVIEKNGYLLKSKSIDNNDMYVLYISKHDALKILKIIKKDKKIDFNSLIGEEPKQIMVTVDVVNPIDDDTIENFEYLLNENNK